MMKNILLLLMFVFPMNTMILNVVACGENNDVELQINSNLDYLNAFKLAFDNYKPNLITDNPSKIDLTSDLVDMDSSGYFFVNQNFCNANNNSHICTYNGKKISNDAFRKGNDGSTNFDPNQISNIQFGLDEIAKSINLPASSETDYRYDFSNYSLTEDYSNLKYFFFGINDTDKYNTYEVKTIGEHAFQINNNESATKDLQVNSMIENNFENIDTDSFIKILSKIVVNNLFTIKNASNFSSLGFYNTLFNNNSSNSNATLDLQYNLMFENSDTSNGTKLYNYNLQNIVDEFIKFVQENYLFNSNETQDDFLNYSNRVLNNFDLSVSIQLINSNESLYDLNDNFIVVIKNSSGNFHFEKSISISNFIDKTNEEENIDLMIKLLNEKYKIDSYSLGISYENYIESNNDLITKLNKLLTKFFPEEIYTVSTNLLDNNIIPNAISNFEVKIKNNIDNTEFNKKINFSLNSLQQIKDCALKSINNAFDLYFSKNNDINFTIKDKNTIIANVVLEFKNKEFFKFFKLNEVEK